MKIDFHFSSEKLKNRAREIKEILLLSKPVLALSVKDGIFIVSQNKGFGHDKIFSIYNRVGAAMIGNYEDIRVLRQELMRQSITMGDLIYSPRDVTAEILSFALSKTLKSVFENLSARPFELEVMLVQVDEKQENDEIYTISFDGTITKSNSPIAVIGNYPNSQNDKFREAIEAAEKEYQKDWDSRTALTYILQIAESRLPAGLAWEIKILNRLSLGENEEFKDIMSSIGFL